MKKMDLKATEAGVLGYKAALNTMKASSVDLWLATLFGKKRCFDDGEDLVKVALWRGQHYLLEVDGKGGKMKNDGKLQKVKKMVEKLKPQKWWQWLLMYPAILSIFSSAIPTWMDMVKSVEYEVGFSEVASAEEQSIIWERNIDCLAGQNQFHEMPSESEVEISLKICDSGDVLLRAVQAEKPPKYKWIAFTKVKEQVASGSLPLDFLFSDAVAGGQRVLCSVSKGNGIVAMIVETPSGCYLETVNVYSGAVLSRSRVSCASSC